MIFTSIFGILTLVMLARALGFAKAPVLAEAEAKSLATAALPGFRATEEAIAGGGRAALVAAADGRVALVRPHGDRWVVRLVGPADLDRAEVAGTMLQLRPREAMFGATTLDLGDRALLWAGRLAT